MNNSFDVAKNYLESKENVLSDLILMSVGLNEPQVSILTQIGLKILLDQKKY